MPKSKITCVRMNVENHSCKVFYSSGAQKTYTPTSVPVSVKCFLQSPIVTAIRNAKGEMEFVKKSAVTKAPVEVPAGSILASDLIRQLQKLTRDGDRIVDFYSYEWTDNLEDLEYQPRGLEAVKRENGKIRIYISR